MATQIETNIDQRRGGNQQDHPEDNALKNQPEAPVEPARRRRSIIIGVFAAVLVIAVCVVWWLSARDYENTDDARVDGHLNPIAARVEGTIKTVYVEDNQNVTKGNHSSTWTRGTPK